MHDTIGDPADDRSWRAAPHRNRTAAGEVPHRSADEPGAFVRVVEPPPSLAALVDRVVMLEAPERVVRQLTIAWFPDVAVRLVFAVERGRSLPGARPMGGGWWAALLVVPAHLHLTPVSARVSQMISAALPPTGSRLIVPPAAGEPLGSQALPLQKFWGDRAVDLLDQLVNEQTLRRRLLKLVRALEARAPGLARPHPIARHACDLLLRTRGAIRIEAVATSCRCTLRTLHAVLVAETGLRPKHFARILRLRHAVDLLTAGSSLDEAAAHAAFADQPHMTREFRTLFHQSPSSLARAVRAARHPDFPLVLPAYRPITNTGMLISRRPRVPKPKDPS